MSDKAQQGEVITPDPLFLHEISKKIGDWIKRDRIWVEVTFNNGSKEKGELIFEDNLSWLKKSDGKLSRLFLRSGAAEDASFLEIRELIGEEREEIEALFEKN